MLDRNEKHELGHQIGQIEIMVRSMGLPSMEAGQILKQMECLREAWLGEDCATLPPPSPTNPQEVALNKMTEMARDATRVPRPLDDWHEDDGDALWWCWRDGEWLGEAPYIGSPLDLGHTVECHTHAESGEAPAARFNVGGWPGYHTHWTPLPSQPYAPGESN